MDIRDQKIGIIAFVLIFLSLYLPLMGRPLNFEELRLTTYFHSQPSEHVKIFNPELKEGSRFSQHWHHYLELNPPGLMIFYFVWDRLSFGDEVFLRIPLLLLTLFAFKRLYHLLSQWTSKSESSILLLLLGLFPMIYHHSSTLTPVSFNFFLVIISFSYFYDSIQQKDLSNKSLIITNLFGLLNSYFFLFVVLTQCLSSVFNPALKNKKTFNLLTISVAILVVLNYVFIVKQDIYNPLIFYWGELKGGELRDFFEFTLLGRNVL